MRKSSWALAALLVLSLLATTAAQEPTRLFLPVHTVDNVTQPKLEVDAAGGIHIALSSITSEGFHYIYCEPGCSGSGQVHEVPFTSTGYGSTVALDLDPQGKPHILVNGHGTLGYAFCDGDCRVDSGWKYGVLTSFEPYGETDREVSGNGLAVGPDGRAHFLLHGARALIGQVHSTWYYTCASNCHLAGNWSGSLIEPEQNYTYSDLHVRPDGVLVAGMIAELNYDLGMENSLGAYMECHADCARGENWLAVGLTDAYDGFWQDVPPAISLELDAGGNPRLAMLAMDEAGAATLLWLHCDAADCLDGNSWNGQVLLDESGYSFGAGVDLELDAAGNPRITYTVLGTIMNAVCSADCTGAGDWQLEMIESGDHIDPDDIFLYTNCVIGAWFLSDGQSALLPDGRVASVYTAEDYSFGSSVPAAPGQPACPVGLDMSLGRLSLLNPE